MHFFNCSYVARYCSASYDIRYVIVGFAIACMAVCLPKCLSLEIFPCTIGIVIHSYIVFVYSDVLYTFIYSYIRIFCCVCVCLLLSAPLTDVTTLAVTCLHLQLLGSGRWLLGKSAEHDRRVRVSGGNEERFPDPAKTGETGRNELT